MKTDFFELAKTITRANAPQRVHCSLKDHASMILGCHLLVNREDELSPDTRGWIKEKLDRALNDYAFDDKYAYPVDNEKTDSEPTR